MRRAVVDDSERAITRTLSEFYRIVRVNAAAPSPVALRVRFRYVTGQRGGRPYCEAGIAWREASSQVRETSNDLDQHSKSRIEFERVERRRRDIDEAGLLGGLALAEQTQDGPAHGVDQFLGAVDGGFRAITCKGKQLPPAFLDERDVLDARDCE